jgi:hypothetical protein
MCEYHVLTREKNRLRMAAARATEVGRYETALAARKWYLRNREKAKAKSLAYYRAHKDECDKKSKEYRALNHDRYLARLKRWRLRVKAQKRTADFDRRLLP